MELGNFWHVLIAMVLLAISSCTAEEGSKTNQTSKSEDSEAHGSYDSTSIFTNADDEEGPIGHNFREGEYSYNYYTQNSKIVGTGIVTDNGHVKIFDNSESVNFKPPKYNHNINTDGDSQNFNHGEDISNQHSNTGSDAITQNFENVKAAQIQGILGTNGQYSYGGSIGHNTDEGKGGTSFVYVSQSGHQNQGEGSETYYPDSNNNDNNEESQLETEEHVLGESSDDDSSSNVNEPTEHNGHTINGYNTNLDLTSSNVQEGTYVVTDHGDTVSGGKSMGDVKQMLNNAGEAGGSVSYIFVSQGVSDNQDIVNHGSGAVSVEESGGESGDETSRSGNSAQFGATSNNQAGSQSISRAHTPHVADFGLTVDSEGQNMGQIFGNSHTSGGLGLQTGVRDGNQGHFYGGHINHASPGLKPGTLTDKHLFGGNLVKGHDTEDGGNFGLQMPGSVELEGHPDAGHSYGGNQVIHHNAGDGANSFGINQHNGHETSDKHLFENQGTTEENSGFHGSEEFNGGNHESEPSFGLEDDGGSHNNGGGSHQNGGFPGSGNYNANNPFKSNNGASFGGQNEGFNGNQAFKGSNQFKHNNGPAFGVQNGGGNFQNGGGNFQNGGGNFQNNGGGNFQNGGGNFQNNGGGNFQNGGGGNFQNGGGNNGNSNGNKGHNNNSPFHPLNFNNGPAFESQYKENLNQFKAPQNLGQFGQQNKPNNKPNFGQGGNNFGQGGNNFGQGGTNFGQIGSNFKPNFGNGGHNNNGPSSVQSRPNTRPNFEQQGPIKRPNFGHGGPDLGVHVEGEVGGTGNVFGNNQNGNNFANNFGSYGQKIKSNVAGSIFNQNQYHQNKNNGANAGGTFAQKTQNFGKIKHHNKDVAIRHQTKVKGISNAVLFGGHSRSSPRSHNIKPNGNMWAGHMMNENFRFGIQKNTEGHYVGLPQNKYVNNNNNKFPTFDNSNLGGQYDSRSKYAEGQLSEKSKSYDVKEPNTFDDNMKFVNVPFAKQTIYPSAVKGQLTPLPHTIYRKVSNEFGSKYSNYAPSSGYKTINVPVYMKKIRSVQS